MAAKKKKKKPGPPASLIGLQSALSVTPDDIEGLRGKVFDIVRKNIPRIHEVFDGSRIWSNQQVKLYLSLMDKVLPSLTASHNIHEHVNSLDDLSLDDLKRLAASEIRKLNPQPPSSSSSFDKIEDDVVLSGTPHVPLLSPLSLSDDLDYTPTTSYTPKEREPA